MDLHYGLAFPFSSTAPLFLSLLADLRDRGQIFFVTVFVLFFII
jgi:hypothetical protein